MKKILRETTQRLTFNNSKLQELEECLENTHLSQSAKDYLREQIQKTKKNINYYSEIQQQLLQIKNNLEKESEC